MARRVGWTVNIFFIVLLDLFDFLDVEVLEFDVK